MPSNQKTPKVARVFRQRKSRDIIPLKTAAASPVFQAVPAAPNPFPIIGLGASAGGLEALEQFLAHVPPDCGMAFVVVTHQHPGHTSLLPELLGKRTRMPVKAAADGMAVEPNTVYLSLPEVYLAILHGTLHLMAPEENGLLRLPIDYFFRSLAEDQKGQAIGIVLSGTGTDGTLGLKAIKEAAGTTMAQEPDSAKYSGMPGSAIATGQVDYILPVERLPERLIEHHCQRYSVIGREDGVEAELSVPMQKILLLVRGRTGHDFSLYKTNTIVRRIERRMNLHGLPSAQAYQRLLHENSHELDLLFKELLISVTSFFRDGEAFEALAKTVLPTLLAAHGDNSPVRVWAAGCASGEEAYSLAMTLQEGMDRLKTRLPVQIFGTDLDATAIDAARSGLYPEGIVSDVSPQRLARFFIKEAGGFRIKKEIRELVIFAPQDVLKDPPFNRLDLVACRNLLIYMKPAAQARLLSLFHYVLKPGGILFLGTSESITGSSEHFAVVNKKWKIFTRKDTGALRTLPSGFTTLPVRVESDGADVPDVAVRTPQKTFSAMIEKALLIRYAPASVIVNDRGDILYIHGRTGDYLEPATGQPRLNILEMAREGLRLELPAALRRAAMGKEEVVHEGVRVKNDGSFCLVRLAVMRLTEPESIRGLLLVTFEREPAGKTPGVQGKTSRRPKPSPPPGPVPELERELRYTRETLQTTIEELQTSNEELQSTNEELQSANEELETSREEMQSLNEELQTVNAQLQGRLDDLAQSDDDMQNLLNSTNIATIFLDQDLHIKRFTAEATKLVKLIPSDVGRPIGDLASNLHYDGLSADATEVLRHLGSKEKEVQTHDGEWRQVRITPYRTKENVIDGLCITFVNIDRLKSAEGAIQQALDYAESIVATVREPLIVLDEKLCVVSANAAFHRTFKTSTGAVKHQLIYELGDGQWDIPALRKLLEEVLARNATFEDFRVEHDFPGLGPRTMLLNARRLKVARHAPGMVLLAFADVTAGRKPGTKLPRLRKDSPG
jgi:two-component system CheB/CheR fusion protein